MAIMFVRACVRAFARAPSRCEGNLIVLTTGCQQM